MALVEEQELHQVLCEVVHKVHGVCLVQEGASPITKGMFRMKSSRA